MKNLPNIFHGITVLFLLTGCIESESSVQVDVAGAEPVVRVTAGQLFEDYDANEIAADEKYKDRVIAVSGTVDDIGKDILDTMYITLQTENSIMSVQCMFADEHSSQLADFSKGQRVVVKGKCDGKLGNVLLRGCVLE